VMKVKRRHRKMHQWHSELCQNSLTEQPNWSSCINAGKPISHSFLLYKLTLARLLIQLYFLLSCGTSDKRIRSVLTILCNS
jgi:hypothetical protein